MKNETSHIIFFLIYLIVFSILIPLHSHAESKEFNENILFYDQLNHSMELDDEIDDQIEELDIQFFELSLTNEMYLELKKNNENGAIYDNDISIEMVKNFCESQTPQLDWGNICSQFKFFKEFVNKNYPNTTNRALGIGIVASLSRDFGFRFSWETKIHKSNFRYYANIGFDSVSNYNNDRLISPVGSTGFTWKKLYFGAVARYYPGYRYPQIGLESGLAFPMGKKNWAKDVSVKFSVSSYVVTTFGVKHIGFPLLNVGANYNINYTKKIK